MTRLTVVAFVAGFVVMTAFALWFMDRVHENSVAHGKRDIEKCVGMHGRPVLEPMGDHWRLLRCEL